MYNIIRQDRHQETTRVIATVATEQEAQKMVEDLKHLVPANARPADYRPRDANDRYYNVMTKYLVKFLDFYYIPAPCTLEVALYEALRDDVD